MKAFVLGHPIEHSLSPDLHLAAYSALGIDIDYQRRDTLIEDFDDRLASGNSDSDFLGFSVTMPLKKKACAAVQHISDLGEALGVVNTVYWRTNKSGQRESYGHNTDVSGIVNALVYAGLQAEPTGMFAVIGGGGTAISALVAGYVLGFRKVDVYVRNTSRASDVLDVAERIGMECQLLNLSDFTNAAASYEAVISTLPAKSADDWAHHISKLHNGAVLLDVSYDPWPSILAEHWTSLGGAVVSGLEMLLYQAFEQVKLFTGFSVAHRFDNELDVLNAMAVAIDLPVRKKLPTPVTGLN